MLAKSIFFNTSLGFIKPHHWVVRHGGLICKLLCNLSDYSVLTPVFKHIVLFDQLK